MLKNLWARLRLLAGSRGVDRELDAEVRLHVGMHTRTDIQAGVRRGVLSTFGAGEKAKEAAHETRRLWLDSAWQDLRFGLRGLRRYPGFTAAVVLTLGLGIGANSAVFSVVNGVMLRPLPVRDADRLTVLAVSRGAGGTPGRLSRLDMEDYRSQSDAFEDIAGYAMDFSGLSADNRADRVLLTYVSGNYFEMLGVRPAAGRLIRPTEGRASGADPVLVLSYGYWCRRFNSDPNVVGKAVRLNGHPFTIVGVAPEGFHGAYAFIEMDLFAPLGTMTLNPVYATAWNDRADRGVVVTLGRLKRGVSLRAAQASLDVVGRRLAARYPETNKDVRPHVFWETYARPDANAAPVLPLVGSVFLGLVGLVLLVACLNVAGLLLVRGTSRARELTLRNALGAGRLRLVRQLVTESLLLSVLGGSAGVMIAAWATRVLGTIRLPNDLPIRLDFGLDWRVCAYVAAAVLLSAFTAGLVPAIRASGTHPVDVLRQGSRGAPAGGGSRHRLRDMLVVTQVAGSLVILVIAGLFIRSLASAHRIELGFQPDHVMNFFMDPAQQGYDQARTKAFYRDLVARVRSMPGVESASVAHSVPLGYYNRSTHLEKEGQKLAPTDEGLEADYNLVDADYQRTMGIQVLRGRWFAQADEDDGRPAVVVNQSLAQRLWPGEDPLGKRFRLRDDGSPLLEVIGVARDGKYGSIFERPTSFIYMPHALEYTSLRVLHVRTTGRPERVVPMVRKEVASLAPDVPVFDVNSMRNAVGGGNGFFLFRMAVRFASALGLLGLALAVVGLYGVVAYSTGQRTHEIGVRIALGAERRHILSTVVSRGLWLVAAGGTVGMLLALGLGRFLTSLLFDVKSYDLFTYATVAGVLTLVGMGACYLPARRAMRVDPTVALRGE
jgi:macrolide transport system ATP-binding/permease protein